FVLSLVVSVLDIVCFFQAEDGIRDDLVTGVQTCALPISRSFAPWHRAKTPRARGGAPVAPTADTTQASLAAPLSVPPAARRRIQIGRAACRERGKETVVVA